MSERKTFMAASVDDAITEATLQLQIPSDKLGYEVIDKLKYEEMWPTQSHCQYRVAFFKYYGPDNVKLVKPLPAEMPVQNELF